MRGSVCRALLLWVLLQVQVWESRCQEEEEEAEVLEECGTTQYRDESGHCQPCTQCPPGMEPDGACGFGAGSRVKCRACAEGMFSSRLGVAPCSMHSRCDKKKREQLRAGTKSKDAVCGNCIAGHVSLMANSSNICVPCWLSPRDAVGCEGQRTLRPVVPRKLEAAKKPENKTEDGAHRGGSHGSHTQYTVLAIVPVFSIMGLAGIFLCNFLKRKGYRCTSQKPDEEAAVPEKDALNAAGLLEENDNEDTIGVLVRLIAEKKENAMALEELLKDFQTKQMPGVGSKSPQNRLHLLPQMPNLCRHQQHLHTVQGLASRSGVCCSRCSQKKWPSIPVSQSANNFKALKNGYKSSRSGEITILAVGRFRVARIPEQKSNPEVKAACEASAGEHPGEPQNETPEQRTLLSNTVRAKDQSQEDTSKLEDVI